MNKLVVLLLFIPILTNAQDTEDRIKNIRAWYKDIESRLDKCVEIPFTMYYDENYDKGGSSDLMGYYDTVSMELIKVVEHNYMDWAEDISSYYYYKGDLFFIYQNGYTPGEMFTATELGISDDELWESGGEAKTLEHYQNRYYFLDKNCIQYLHKEAEVDIDKEADLKDVEHKELSTESSDIVMLNHNGYRFYEQLMLQLKPKK
jgi:hypothetical protein